MELYGVDLPVLVNGLYPMVIRVPGWVNFGILRSRNCQRGNGAFDELA